MSAQLTHGQALALCVLREALEGSLYNGGAYVDQAMTAAVQELGGSTYVAQQLSPQACCLYVTCLVAATMNQL